MARETWALRARETVAASKLAREAEARRSWTREQLRSHQREALRRTLEHALRHSRFYAEHLGAAGVRADSPVEALPVLDKRTMVEHFDDLVCDPRVRLADLQRFLEAGGGAGLFAGEFRVLRTGGSSRIPGVFVYGRTEWPAVVSSLLRSFEMIGIRPKVPRRRVSTLLAPGAVHMASRISATIDIGLNATQRLAVTQPVQELVDGLNAHGPQVLGGYPSLVAVLAAEQLEGRLRIAPEHVITSSEPRTPEMTDRMRAAWGVEPYEMYASTETGGIVAADCPQHRGLHLFEDACIVEVVDAEGRPVPDGEEGERVLVTNLLTRTQPIIRMELTDVVRVLPEPCPCGRPHRLIAPVQGRSDDVLELPAAGGGTVAVHPMAFASLGTVPGVREFQVVQRADGLHVTVAAPAGNGVAGHVRDAVRAALEPVGVAGDLEPRVELVDAIVRDPARAGKVKLVRREP